jgi:hypothetical protein
MEHLWKVISGEARVDVRQYDRPLAGADYISKCLGANAYELDKYSFANTVTVFVGYSPDSEYRRKWRQTLRPGQVKKRAGVERARV